MSPKPTHELLENMRKRYKKASGAEKSVILEILRKA